VHPGLVFPKDLKPVQAEIPLPAVRMMSQHHSERNEASGIARPALENRKAG
jgi:hypothetical protein